MSRRLSSRSCQNDRRVSAALISRVPPPPQEPLFVKIPGTADGFSLLACRCVGNIKRPGLDTVPSRAELEFVLLTHCLTVKSAPLNTIPTSRRPPITLALILQWADDHYQRTAKYPSADAGPVRANGAPSTMSWRKIDKALRRSSAGRSLAGLLAKYRGVVWKAPRRPRLTEDVIQAWVSAFQAATGRWPTARDGRVPDAAGETWGGIDTALRHGARGLAGGSSLAKLIVDRRLSRVATTPLTITRILRMAYDHWHIMNRWPDVTDEPIAGHPGETWSAINNALEQGTRGLPGGSSLADLLRTRGRMGGS
jgi:hypothetical protein